jgi:transposase InsO family protein
VGQFGLLDQMQMEFEQEDTVLDVRILGLNARGLESGNEGAVAGKTIPWLQDTEEVKAWDLWGVTWRDVYVLDAGNRVVAVYNLTEHSLSRPAAYDSLKTILRRAAR